MKDIIILLVTLTILWVSLLLPAVLPDDITYRDPSGRLVTVQGEVISISPEKASQNVPEKPVMDVSDLGTPFDTYFQSDTIIYDPGPADWSFLGVPGTYSPIVWSFGNHGGW